MKKNSMLEQELQMEYEELERMSAELKLKLNNSVEGRVQCRVYRKKYNQFYLVKKGEKTPQYLSKDKLPLISRLVQQEYDEKMLCCIEEQKRAIRIFLNRYKPDALKSVHAKMAEPKRVLVQPYVLSDEAYLHKWYSDHPGNQNGIQMKASFATDRGELVRSKSEKIIADMLFRKQIPYVYEARLILSERIQYYPDFLILNQKNRQTIAFEHFGMMDDPDYCRNAQDKLETYQRFGFWPGENLLISMESSTKPLNIRQVEVAVDHILR